MIIITLLNKNNLINVIIKKIKIKKDIYHFLIYVGWRECLLKKENAVAWLTVETESNFTRSLAKSLLVK